MRFTNHLLVIFFVISFFHRSFAEHVEGEYILHLNDSSYLIPSNQEILAKELEGSISVILPEFNLVKLSQKRKSDPSTVLPKLRKHVAVKIAEPNYKYFTSSVDDQYFSEQWNLKNTGQADRDKVSGVAGVDIGAIAAWQKHIGDQDLVVAVIDTGVDYNHEELKQNRWTNIAEIEGKPGVDDDGNGFVDDLYGMDFSKPGSSNPMDTDGHGTHVAGIIGANSNNSVGIAGIAWQVKILPVKFIGEGFGTLENAVKAIDYAIKARARILNNSWRGTVFSQILLDAISRANQAGALFIAAAGNDRKNLEYSPVYPAANKVENVISVAAINNKGEMALFSNYSRKDVHIAAPGTSILSLGLKDKEGKSTYTYKDGTSMAAPHVSAVAALLMSYQPQLTHLEVKERLLKTAQPLHSLFYRVESRGYVHAANALSDTVPPALQEDPAQWQQLPLLIASEHPYKDGANHSYTLKIAGAKKFALYFERFETELGYDFLKLYDENDQLLYSFSGIHSDTYTPIIEGNFVRIHFTSDGTKQDYGFKISAAGVK